MKRAHLQMQRKMARPVNARRPWLDLVDHAKLEAARASGTTFIPTRGPPARDGGVLSSLDGLELLRHARGHCHKDAFPVEGPSAGLVAAAFLQVVDAFASRATAPERREAFAAAVAGCADAVSALLEEQRSAEQARSWQSQMERD